jgi:hypothetical protein
MSYQCPLCGSALTERHYHKVVKVQEKQKSEIAELQRQATAAKTALADSKKQAKLDLAAARKQAIASEQKKEAIRHKRLIARIKKLEEEKRMLKKHTSPQEIGLADERVLLRRLKQDFRDDEFDHVGKGGDVLQVVMFRRAEVGSIIYECKRTDRISSDHVVQTALAKKTRQADFGILVTTGTRRGFGGLDQDSGVFLVAQSGVLTLARICRDSLVAMAKQRLDEGAKLAAAKRLMDYVTSPVFRTPLEEAISRTDRAQKSLLKEMRQHANDWRERHDNYQTIHYDISHVQTNIGRVVDGDDPLRLATPQFEPLALPLIKTGCSRGNGRARR